jgi:hypothetical protein
MSQPPGECRRIAIPAQTSQRRGLRRRAEFQLGSAVGGRTQSMRFLWKRSTARFCSSACRLKRWREQVRSGDRRVRARSTSTSLPSGDQHSVPGSTDVVAELDRERVRRPRPVVAVPRVVRERRGCRHGGNGRGHDNQRERPARRPRVGSRCAAPATATPAGSESRRSGSLSLRRFSCK